MKHNSRLPEIYWVTDSTSKSHTKVGEANSRKYCLEMGCYHTAQEVQGALAKLTLGS